MFEPVRQGVLDRLDSTSPPEVKAIGKGRRRWYGDGLATPEEIRQDSSIDWTKVEAFGGGKRHEFDVKVMPAARWIGTGERTVQVVVVRPLAYRPRKGARLLYKKPAYLICTDPNMPLKGLLQSYLWRWEIELNFRDEKTTLGVGDAQMRTPSSVAAVPSLIVASYAFLLLAGERDEGGEILQRPKWRPPKQGERRTMQQLQCLFRSQLWKIALDVNLTRFVKHHPSTRSLFYCLTLGGLKPPALAGSFSVM